MLYSIISISMFSPYVRICIYVASTLPPLPIVNNMHAMNLASYAKVGVCSTKYSFVVPTLTAHSPNRAPNTFNCIKSNTLGITHDTVTVSST